MVISMSSNVLAINATYYTTGGTISVPWEFRNDVQYTAGGTYMYMPGGVQKSYYSFDNVTMNETILKNGVNNEIKYYTYNDVYKYGESIMYSGSNQLGQAVQNVSVSDNHYGKIINKSIRTSK